MLAKVVADDPRLDRLLQLYMHEWSALLPIALNEEARFVYAKLPNYRDVDRHVAYLILDDRRPLGFVLARRDEGECWHVEEFFVIHGARRRGIGIAAMRALVALHPGAWTLTVRFESPAALQFWRRAVPGADERVEVGTDGIQRTRLSWTESPR